MDSRLLSQHFERVPQLLAQRFHQDAAPLAVELARPAQVPREMAGDISTWRPVARDEEEVMGSGLSFLRGKAAQYGMQDFVA